MEKKSILIFGAGKIGRSFIGQLFGLSGYEVVFSDIDVELVALLNLKKSYNIVIKGDKEERITIFNVRAINGNNEEAVTEEVKNTSIVAVSVGKNALLKIVPILAKGLIKRFQNHEHGPVDIIIAENMRSANEVIYKELKNNLPLDFPLDDYVGLVETSIGKMVPIMTADEINKDPLAVFAEPYNQLILDKKGFRNEVPNVMGLAPKENIRAWVDRKAFIHNLGHATAAYYGFFKYPGSAYLYEVLEDKHVLEFTRRVMLQSAAILLKIYPEDFTPKDLSDHIEDLLFRFRNRALKDTLFRVGQDIPRKLGPDDRFMGIIRLGIPLKMPYDKILEAMSYAFFFKATDENGRRHEQDIVFEKLLSQGIDYTLQKVCGIDPVFDQELAEKVKISINVKR
ncbi:MAG: hypothetical protein VB075_01795 [Petrimonas sp.]|jgi:mannitol-1-phosphate 5-dehydrogenase|uniref:mannitol dehydrogenase family protein n=1 Tax=Petrimonas sp. TaxID=2023866 RepID=UPI000E81CE1C|nr:hypothetical protein [Petrimonas sp.]MEA5043299.1 hypothetical protein [Petrimonas sp.]HBU46445.1 mannitol-1-phosphate 5-dehydrogenase [Porphyromonadaceae bacterium]